MTDLHINLWGVLLGSISSMIIGAVYYSPQVFGKLWMKLGKVDEKAYKKDTPKLMPIIFLGALIVSYFVAYFSFLYHDFFQNSWLSASVQTAFLLWVGFVATTVIVHNALDQRPRQLIYLTLGNRFLSLIAIGLLVGWLHP